MGASYFHTVDWLVVAAYFALVWLISHRVQGRQTGTHEYFLGSRSLPWPAVAASIVSTAISGVTFIGVPALVFAQGGDYRYLQFALGQLVERRGALFQSWLALKMRCNTWTDATLATMYQMQGPKHFLFGDAGRHIGSRARSEHARRLNTQTERNHHDDPQRRMRTEHALSHLQA